MDDDAKTRGDIGFIGLLTIVFITLKLIGKISWSWIWVLCPIWLYALWLMILTIVIVIADRKISRW